MEAQEIINHLGTFSYWGIFGVSLLANVVVPVPEEIVLLAFGYLAGSGHASVYVILPIIALGLLVSDIVMYYLSRGGNKLVKGFYEKFFEHQLESKQDWIQHHVGKVIFYSRFMIQLRFLGPFTAGQLHVPLKKFLFYEIAALVLYVPLYVFIGFYFQSRIVRIINGVDLLRDIVLITFGVVLIVSLLRYLYKRFILN